MFIIIRGEPERAPSTRVTYGEFTVPMYVCMYVCSDTSSTCSQRMRNMLAHYIITINDLARMLKYRVLDLKVVIYAEG